MELIHDGGAYRVDDDVFVRQDGSFMPVSYIVTPLLMKGEIAGSVTGFTDITERKKAELEREQLIRDLDSFAGTVAHDLKAPVNMIVGYADVIRQLGADLSLENIQSYLNIIIKNTRKMTTVIDEILLLAGVRGSDPTLMEIDMRRVVYEAQQRVEHFIDDFESEIIVADDWPSVVGHGPWIEEVWANYLTNAHKYGGNPPRVEVGWSELGDGYIQFWVKDNGKGLTPEEQAKLFNPFVRLDQIRAKGHGLGLSIVRRIMEKLGGQVGVESELGVGSTFYFTLPAAD
jgi:signal transduction histidine kinase